MRSSSATRSSPTNRTLAAGTLEDSSRVSALAAGTAAHSTSAPSRWRPPRATIRRSVPVRDQRRLAAVRKLRGVLLHAGLHQRLVPNRLMTELDCVGATLRPDVVACRGVFRTPVQRLVTAPRQLLLVLAQAIGDPAAAQLHVGAKLLPLRHA